MADPSAIEPERVMALSCELRAGEFRSRNLAGCIAALLLVAGVGEAFGRTAARSPAAALPSQVVELQRAALAATTAADLARSLATEAGPRPSGSVGLARGVEWGLRTMKDLGFENVHPEPVTVPHWERGIADGTILSPYPQTLALVALGGSIGTPESGIDGDVVATENLESLAKLPPDAVKGHIVYFGERMLRTRDGAGYGKTVAIRGKGASAAADLGAIAVVIRSVGTDSTRLPHTGGMSYKEGGAKIPAAALSNPDADLLERELASGKPVRLHLHLTARMLPDVESANVVGEVRGRELPQEIVLLCGHLDSWDLGTGAIDDAAGVGNAMAAGAAIAKLAERPRRTIRIVLYTNEEFGLSGGKAYAVTHADEAAQHQAALESDLGSGKVYALLTALAPDDGALAAEIARGLAPLGITLDASKPAAGGADISPLKALGVPILDLAHDATSYFDFHHTANDTADKLVPGDMAQATAAYATAAWILADRPARLARVPVVAEKP
ncbi:MAG: M28 family peptidase [Thermoanaerobaculia bacterium]